MTSSFEPFENRIEAFTCHHPDSPKREIILSRLYFHVFKLFNERQNLNLAEFGLNTTSWFALIMIYSTGENAINPCNLSHAMVSSRTNITRLSDELVEKGWVERNASGEDRRRIVLSLTQQGRTLVEAVLPQQWNYYRELWSAFEPDELEQFEFLLRKLLKRIDASLPEGESCPD
ncbi:MAG: MarR family transcriptional regulator [Burkholderiales bacterium]|nr:MarR family transcriptional regulator [Burkholderiales bacterium]